VSDCPQLKLRRSLNPRLLVVIPVRSCRYFARPGLFCQPRGTSSDAKLPRAYVRTAATPRPRCRARSPPLHLELFRRSSTTTTTTTTTNMSAKIDSETLKQYLADSPPSVVPLAIKPHFDALTDKEKLYAHHLSV
jgi:hypothetical protein